jgi:hypothetical protein
VSAHSLWHMQIGATMPVKQIIAERIFHAEITTRNRFRPGRYAFYG